MSAAEPSWSAASYAFSNSIASMVGVAAIEQVRIGTANDHIAEHVAQIGHVRVQRRSAGRRGIVAVERLEQGVDRHGSATGGDEHRDNGPLLRPAECTRRPIGEHIERTEHPTVHAATIDRLLDARFRRLDSPDEACQAALKTFSNRRVLIRRP